MAVAALRQRDLGQPPLQRILLVAHLVGGVDPDAAQRADRQRQTDLRRPTQAAVIAEPTEIGRGEQVGAEDNAEVLERDVDVGAVAVVLVVLQTLHHLLGRVLPVGSVTQIEDRQQKVGQHRPNPEQRLRGGLPAGTVQSPHERQDHQQCRRGDQAHQPQVTLLVPPGSGSKFGAHIAQASLVSYAPSLWTIPTSTSSV